MNFNNMIIVKGNLFIEREIFLCNFQSCIQEHNFFVYHIHVQLLYIWWIDAFNIHEHLFIYFLSIENVSFIFFLSNLFLYFFLFFFFLNIHFINKHFRSAELGESRDFDDEDQSIFSLQTEPSNNMKSLVRVSPANVLL